MLVVFFLLHFPLAIVKSPLIIDRFVAKSSFITKTCYKSNTYPIQFFELLHNFPTGPLNLYVISEQFIFQRELNYLPINITQIHQFIRIDDPCPRSFRYSTTTKSISAMNLIIEIYLLDKITLLSIFKYKFFDGFETGFYLLIDVCSNFAVIADITNFSQNDENNMQTTLTTWPNLESISKNYRDICITTSHSKPVILHPKYDNGSSPGFITQIIRKTLIDGILIIYKHVAFECQSDESFNEGKVVIIEEDLVDVNLSFFVISHQYNYFNHITSEIYLTIPELKTIKVSQLKNLSSNIKRLFFIHQNRTRTLSDMEERMTIYFYSTGGICYEKRHIEDKSVLPYVKRLAVITELV